MEKAFSDKVVQSSNIEDDNSSGEEKEDILILDADELKKHLKNISSFNKKHKKRDVDDVESNGY